MARAHVGERPLDVLDELTHAPASRALVTVARRVGPVADRGAGAVGGVVDLEVETVERSQAAVLEQVDRRLDPVARGRLGDRAVEPVQLVGLVTGADRHDVLGADPDLGVVVAVGAVLGVRRVDVDLDRVLDPRVGTRDVHDRVGDVHQDVQVVVTPERLDGRRGAGGTLDGLARDHGARAGPHGVDVAVDRRCGGRVRHLEVGQRLDERDGARRALVGPAGDRGAGVVDLDVEVERVALGDAVDRQVRHDGVPVTGVLEEEVHVGVAVAVHRIGLTLDDERHRVRRVDVAVLDRHVRGQVVGRPAELELTDVADRVQRQLGPLERLDGVLVDRDGTREDVARADARVEVAVDRTEVRRLGGQGVVEQQRRLLAAPAAVVGEAPDRHRVQVLGERPEHPEGVAQVVALLDDRRGGHRGAHRDVELGDRLDDLEVLEPLESGLEVLDGHRQRHVELVTHAVDRNLGVEQVGHQGVEPRALGRLLGVVVVDEQRDRAGLDGVVDRVGLVERLVGVDERLRDEVGAHDVVPVAGPQAVRRRLVGDDLVHDVERDDRVGLATELAVLGRDGLGDVEDVRAQALVHLVVVGRGEELTVLVLEEPVRRLAVPHERVAVDPQVVRLGEVQDCDGLRVHPEVALGVVPGLDLHEVLMSDLVEVVEQQLGRRTHGLA